ncbi:MAG: hypothetical protein ACFFDT_13250 [Candidatus Hodarchaeota archaeon]
MNNLIKKALTIGTPFVVLIISFFIVSILTHSYSSPSDEEWVTRQFLIGMIMFAGFTIIPRLIHFQLFFSGMIPSCTINLCHHPPLLHTTHEFKIGSYSICSGCFGSLLSILIAEFIFLGYFVRINLFDKELITIYLMIGLIMIILSYSRYFIILKPSARLIQHICLFPGLALTLIAGDLFFNSAFSMIILLPSWVLFLVGRVKLAELNHKEYPQSDMSFVDPQS